MHSHRNDDNHPGGSKGRWREENIEEGSSPAGDYKYKLAAKSHPLSLQGEPTQV